jgi:serine/threonine protein kinase
VNEVDQAEKIAQWCGTPTEEVWPGVSHLPWYRIVLGSKPAVRPRVLRERFTAAGFPADAVDLLDRLLCLDPSRRLSADEALRHEYFRNEPREMRPADHPRYDENHHEFVTKSKNREAAAEAARSAEAARAKAASAALAPPQQQQQQSLSDLSEGEEDDNDDVSSVGSLALSPRRGGVVIDLDTSDGDGSDAAATEEEREEEEEEEEEVPTPRRSKRRASSGSEGSAPASTPRRSKRRRSG